LAVVVAEGKEQTMQVYQEALAVEELSKVELVVRVQQVRASLVEQVMEVLELAEAVAVQEAVE
jgi:hypothetical protein